jgi:hypothetical protein
MTTNFKLYQIHLTDSEYDLVNEKGHDAVPKQKAKLDIQFADDPGEVAGVALELDYYKHVANITADSLEGVFNVGNMGPEENIERLDDMYSVSVGDVVEDELGNMSVVASAGFKAVI